MEDGQEQDFREVLREPDPLRRGKRAGALLTLYQQRATELARLRREAIEEAHSLHGLSYTEIAAALGITKGRVTQIRGSAPPPERAFFGVGPVTIAVPVRSGVGGRALPVLAAEDAATADQLAELLGSLSLAVSVVHLDPNAAEPPAGDTVVVCGPKTAPVGAALLAQDPRLSMEQHGGRWTIRHGTDRYESPMDDEPPTDADVAYLARHQEPEQVIVHIAGIHAIGSLGAAHYLGDHLAELFRKIGHSSASLAVRSSYAGVATTASELAAGPFPW